VLQALNTQSEQHASVDSLTCLVWLALGAFAIGTEGFMIAGLLAALARDLNVGLPAAGHLVTAFSLAYAVGAPVMAVLTAGLERRRLLAVAMGGFAPIPANARLASYLPFEWILPKADVFVTNGGYGSVNQAMSFGVPLVTAGLTEDKADVNARVAWSGAGINLATNAPTPQVLRDTVRTRSYCARASLMAKEFARIDTRAEILRIVGELSQNSAASLSRGA
jgi:hypothetical protein